MKAVVVVVAAAAVAAVTATVMMVSYSLFNYRRKDFKRMSGFDPITFTFNESSNYWWESLLEV